MRRLTIALVVLMTGSLVYCDDPTGILGPLGFGVVEGREQTVSADEPSMDPVRAKVWRDAQGNAFLGVGAMPLYAQQGVTSVANAVVCVGEEPLEGDPIIPHSRCTMSDADGNAVFHLAHPKRAATHRTGIVAEVDGEALTPDTIVAEVLAGAPVLSYGIYASNGTRMFDDRQGDSLLVVRSLRDAHSNQTYEFQIESLDPRLVADTTYKTRSEGSPALRVLNALAVGDTAGLVLRYADGVHFADVIAEAIATSHTDADGTRFDSWALQFYKRDQWRP